jgi:infAE-imm
MKDYKYIIKLISSIFIFLFISIFYSVINIKYTHLNSNVIYIINSFTILVSLTLLYFKEIKEDIKNFKLKNLSISLKYYIIGLTIYFIYQLIISKTITSNIPSNEEMVRNLFKANIFIAFISACFLAPILEEILFRFTLFKCTNNKYIFLLTSSILFSLFHVTNLQSIVQIFFLCSYLILSFTLSYILYKSKNICNSILVHSIHNLFMALLLFLGG